MVKNGGLTHKVDSGDHHCHPQAAITGGHLEVHQIAVEEVQWSSVSYSLILIVDSQVPDRYVSITRVTAAG